MKLFLCSHFSSVGSLIKEEIDNKKVAFIPTASLREGYTGYVGSARKLFNKLGAAVTEIDISTEAYLTIQSVFEDADVIYFTGGNSFFLMDQLRKTGTDELLKKELEKGKLMIGESAGAIICAPTIQYIEQMDEKPEDYSQEDDAGLDLIDFYVLPHYLTAPFKKVMRTWLNRGWVHRVKPGTGNSKVTYSRIELDTVKRLVELGKLR